jgi:eukaryotic-like serine/threonine-protein kinase
MSGEPPKETASSNAPAAPADGERDGDASAKVVELEEIEAKESKPSIPVVPARPSAHQTAAGRPPGSASFAVPLSAAPPPVVPGAGRPVADDEDPLLGTVLADRVRVERAIARGGMGKVYYGEQVGMRRPCAIKILDPRLAGGADTMEFARRFLLEASTAAKLTHPNVVTIFDYGETADGACFIAMEYLEGRSVSEELKKQGRVAPERAIHIAKQVCRALREAHAIGVVHRDMKPGNVFLVKQDDDDDFVKVLDFGLVKETSPSDSQDHTQIGQIMGSPRYMAPEQVQGKTVDSRTDIYSLGVMLYAMLSGKPPFDKATELATMMAQVSDVPPPLASVAPDLVLPPGLDAVVMKCLAKNPDDRFSSMEELITALKLRPGAMTTSSDSGRHTQSPLLTAPATTDSMSGGASKRRGTLPVILIIGAVVGVALTAALLTRQDSSPAQAVSMPSAPLIPPPPPPLPPPPPAPKVTATLHVETDPPGAKVKEEGDLVCEATPCDINYSGEQADPTYEHLLTFLKADFKLERKLVKVSASPISVHMTRAR